MKGPYYFLALPLVLLACLAGAADRQPLQPLDLFDLQWVTDPRISPDGKQIVYVRQRLDVMQDRSRSSLWIVDGDGDDHQALTDNRMDASQPRWSPDGKRLAYIASQDGNSQIHVLWLQSGRATAITQLQHPPAALTWSPDGTRLAFTQFVPVKQEPIGKPIDRPEGATWNDEPKVFEDSYYRSDASGFLKPGKRQVFVVDAEGGKPIQLTDAEYPHNGNLSWSAQGRHLYFASNYRDNWQLDRPESEIYRVDVETREVTQVTDRDGGDYSPQVSPDGSYLLYRGADDVGMYQDTKLYITPIDEHAPRELINIDRPITHATWGADSRTVYFSYVDKGVTRVARADLKGRVRQVAEGLGGTIIGRPYASGSFTVADNGALAYEMAATQQPANLAYTNNGRVRQLTNLNRDLLEYRELGEVEELWTESTHDGLPIHGWIIKPPGFDPAKQYPLVLEIHGGPNTAYAGVFAAELQLYAAAGYVVLYTNPRGSTSYGVEFTREIHHDYPGYDYDDLMSAVDNVIGRGYIDPDNLFITGGSGGGILSAWVVTRTDRFRAAVSQKPVINWYTLTYNSDIGPHFWVNFFAAPPWEAPEAYLAKSPISFVDKVSTPTMLLTGEQDWRTPMSESEQFYQGLKMNGVDAALVRIPNSGHGIAARPSGILNKVRYVLGWFDRYRGSADGASSE